METAFIRHNLGCKREILKHFWNNKLIAVHYKNIPSVNPDDYENVGKNSLIRLLYYCKNSALIGATYSELEPSKILVGELKKDSKITIEELFGNYYKVIKLNNVRELSYIDYPILAAIQPRQGTFTGWPSASKILPAIYYKQKLDFDVFSLSPSQLEIVCYEFLRYKGIIKSLLLPIGRSLPHIDIFGVAPNRKNIIAQITFSKSKSEVFSKIELLRKYKSAKTILIFFGRAEFKFSDSDIKYLSIENVFKSLSKNNKEKIYKYALEKMFNW